MKINYYCVGVLMTDGEKIEVWFDTEKEAIAFKSRTKGAIIMIEHPVEKGSKLDDHLKKLASITKKSLA